MPINQIYLVQHSRWSWEKNVFIRLD